MNIPYPPGNKIKAKPTMRKCPNCENVLHLLVKREWDELGASLLDDGYFCRKCKSEYNLEGEAVK